MLHRIFFQLHLNFSTVSTEEVYVWFLISIIILQDNVPVIAVMCNKGMRPRHWKTMSDIAGFDMTPDSGSTLRKVLKLELGEHMEMFEGISAGASKVISLVKSYWLFILLFLEIS